MDNFKQMAPAVAAIIFVGIGFIIARSERPGKHSWLVPAALAALFAAFSTTAVAEEGLFGFWPEHIRNLWGNQIWFDLLLALGGGWLLIAPEAKRLGMRLIPWLIFIVCTGSIGFMAMTARLLYLRKQ